MCKYDADSRFRTSLCYGNLYRRNIFDIEQRSKAQCCRYTIGECRHRFKPDTFVFDMPYDLWGIFSGIEKNEILIYDVIKIPLRS